MQVFPYLVLPFPDPDRLGRVLKKWSNAKWAEGGGGRSKNKDVGCPRVEEEENSDSELPSFLWCTLICPKIRSASVWLRALNVISVAQSSSSSSSSAQKKKKKILCAAAAAAAATPKRGFLKLQNARFRLCANYVHFMSLLPQREPLAQVKIGDQSRK